MIHRATTTPSSVSPALPPVSTSTSVPPSAACSLTLPSRMGPPSWLASGEVIYADLMLRDPKVSMSGCVHIRLGATIHGVQPDPTVKGGSSVTLVCKVIHADLMLRDPELCPFVETPEMTGWVGPCWPGEYLLVHEFDRP